METKLKELQDFLTEMQSKLNVISEEINKKPRERWLLYKDDEYLGYSASSASEVQANYHKYEKTNKSLKIVHFVEVKD